MAIYRCVLIGDNGCGPLMSLRQRLVAALGLNHLARRDFTPHVTLSFSKGAPLPKLQAFLAHHSLFRTAPFEVTHFTLFSSFLGHEHASYHAERSYELSRA